jgi:hypothetical protein
MSNAARKLATSGVLEPSNNPSVASTPNQNKNIIYIAIIIINNGCSINIKLRFDTIM